MPRRCPTGCFNLPCIRKKCPVKDDLRSDEDCPVKNDLSSDDEDCPVGNDLLDLTSEDLCHFTRQFSPENLIGVTHLGKLYRGKMPVDSDATKDVAVKILGHDERLFKYIGDDKLQRLEKVRSMARFLFFRKIRIYKVGVHAKPTTTMGGESPWGWNYIKKESVVITKEN
ncbi:putative myb-like protein X-like isoform X1 [Capsicum annuum]|nr:putative myb-like protein X-like isoform X1 [Capsicum annuum]